MPVQINASGEIENDLDLETEVRLPARSGHYVESLARLDAYIDALIDLILRQVYAHEESLALLERMEKSLAKQYLFVSGNVKLDVLKKTVTRKTLPEDALYQQIRAFKQKRNTALHSVLGYYALSTPSGSNDAFQSAAKREAETAIENGVECYNALKNVYVTNAKSR